MTGLKEQLRSDLTAAMKARDEVRTRTLRMALTSVANEEVAGRTARDLTDADVLRLLTQGGQAPPRGRRGVRGRGAVRSGRG
jgi:uncharacterized protein